MNRIFVYGTLMQGMENHYLIQPYMAGTRPAVVRGGILYHLTEGYPALILADEQKQVRGELIELTDITRALQVLDRLEEYYGADCAENLYDRKLCQTFDAKGNMYDCFVYVWAHPEQLSNNGKRIENGCWRSFLAKL